MTRLHPLQYAFNDFGISQVAHLLGHTDDAQKYENRSLSYRNLWDPSVTSDGFKGMWKPDVSFVADPFSLMKKSS